MPFAQVHYPFENTRLVRAPLPGRLHRRVHRPDARLVLHACTCWPRRCSTGRRSATASATASCSATTARRCPRACATTPTRTRCSTRYGSDAMRWFLMSSPVLRGGDIVGHRAGDPRRACARCCCRCGTSGTSSRSTPTPTAYDGAAGAPTSDARARPLHAGQDRASWSRDVDRRSWTPTTCRGACAAVRSYPGRADQLVHPPSAATGSGPATHDAVRHALHRAGDAVPGGRAAAAADRRGDLARADRRAHRAPDRLAGGRRASRPTTTWSPRWTRCARSARRRCRCARPQGLRVRLPLPSLTVAAPDAAALAPFADLIADEVNVKEVRAHRRRSAGVLRAGADRRCRGRSGPRARRRGAAGDQGGQGRRLVAASTAPSVAAGVALQRGRVRAAAGRRRDADALARRCPAARAWWCSTPRSRPSWRPRAWPATWCGWCSRPAARPAWTSATGSG